MSYRLPVAYCVHKWRTAFIRATTGGRLDPHEREAATGWRPDTHASLRHFLRLVCLFTRLYV